MKISLQTNSTTTKFMSDSDIKKDIKAQENNFMTLYKRVDKSKTKTKIINFKGSHIKVSTYYDKQGKELFTSNQIIDKDALHYTNYNIKGVNGGLAIFVDYDNDGNIDEMGYTDATGLAQYQATDKDDDGKFDYAMHCSGKEIAKTFNLKA